MARINKFSVLIATVLTVLTLCACGTGNSLTKAEREAAVTRHVQECLDTRHYSIAVDWMRPLGGMARHVSSNYELTVDGDDVDSYLPYVGEAYRLPYGGGKGLNFKAPILNYTQTQTAGNCYLIEFDVVNDEDVFHYRIDLFSSGKAIIDIWARDRDSISFQGEMVF
jgi:hypothetical protein